MKKNLLILIVVVLIVINISALATMIHSRWFRPEPPSVGKHGMHPLAFFREELGLDDSQIAAFQARRSSFEEEIAKVAAEVHEKRRALMAEVSAEEPDTLRIDELVNEIGALQAELEKRAIRHMLGEQAILTPEQRQKLYSIFDEHMRKREMKPWHGHKGPRGMYPPPFPRERNGKHGKGTPDFSEESVDDGGRK